MLKLIDLLPLVIMIFNRFNLFSNVFVHRLGSFIVQKLSSFSGLGGDEVTGLTKKRNETSLPLHPSFRPSSKARRFGYKSEIVIKCESDKSNNLCTLLYTCV